MQDLRADAGWCDPAPVPRGAPPDDPRPAGELGERFVRFPRWGTIYARAHVDALGGVERIRDAVRPAVVRELGAEALYFQLTDSVATATSAEALSKQQAFTNLAAPLLPPVVA